MTARNALGFAFALTLAVAPSEGFATTGPPAPVLDATALLRASISAPRSVSYVGQLETLSFGANRSSATIVRVEHRAPDRTRRWYLAPEALYGDYIVTDGSATYQFDTKHSRVTVSHTSTSDGPIPSDDGRFDLALQNYRAVASGDEMIAGHDTHSILLVNRFTGERVERLWLDCVTHLELKKESYHSSGAVASQSRFEDIRYTDAIPDDVFKTTAPSGYTQDRRPDIALPSSDLGRVVAGAGFDVRKPTNLPQGFKLVGGDVASVHGTAHGQADVKSLHLVYSDGIRSLSLFENASGAAADFGTLHPTPVKIANRDGDYVEDGPTTLLAWKERGISFALVGDLQRAELIQIASSIDP